MDANHVLSITALFKWPSFYFFICFDFCTPIPSFWKLRTLIFFFFKRRRFGTTFSKNELNAHIIPKKSCYCLVRSTECNFRPVWEYLDIVFWMLDWRCVFVRNFFEKVQWYSKYYKILKYIRKKYVKWILSYSFCRYKHFDIKIILFWLKMRKLWTFKV